MRIFVAFGREHLRNMHNRENDVRGLPVLKDYLVQKKIITEE